MLPHKPVRLIGRGRYSRMSLSVLFDGSDEMFDIGTTPPQRNYIEFPRVLTNRTRHWDVQTEDWFFEDAAEQSGWAG